MFSCLFISQPTLNDCSFRLLVHVPVNCQHSPPLNEQQFLPYHPQSGHSGLLSTSSTCVILELI